MIRCPHRWSLAIVLVVLAAALTGFWYVAASSVTEQLAELSQQIGPAWQNFQDKARQTSVGRFALDQFGPASRPTTASWRTSRPSRFFSAPLMKPLTLCACQSVASALVDWPGIGPMTFVGFDNYIYLLTQDPSFYQVARNTDGPLAEEFARVLQEMQIGLGRSKALRALGAERAANRDERAQAAIASGELCEKLGRPIDAYTHFRKALDASITASNIKGGVNDAYADLAPFTTFALLPQASNDKLQLYNVTLNQDLDRAQLVSSTSYLHRDTFYQTSAQYPATAFIFGGQPPLMASAYRIGNAITDFAQELRLHSKDGGELKWTAGAFYEQGRRDTRQDQPTAGFDARYAATRNFPGYDSQVHDQAFGPDNYFSGTQNTKSRQLALFAEATYTLWNQLDLTAGLRLFRGTQDFDLRFTGLFGNLATATPAAPTGVPALANSSATARGANPRFAAAWRVDPDHTLYASAGPTCGALHWTARRACTAC